MAESTKVDSLIFGKWAKLYWDKGLAPIPLGAPSSRNAKSAAVTGWQTFARDRIDEDKLRLFMANFAHCNIGIGLGSEVFPGLQLVAVDIDIDKYREAIERAMPFFNCGKRGKKGVTWFALAPMDMNNKKCQGPEGGVMDFLSNTLQTVIPPSIHPDTGVEYLWIGTPLHDFDLHKLPILNKSFLIECDYIAKNRDQYYNGGVLESGDEIPGINNMVWGGVGGGGNTYDSRLRCIGHMVATGWEDDDIVQRIRRAQKEAVERAGDVFDWPDCERETRQQIKDARSKSFDENSKAGKKEKIPQERMWANWAISDYDHPVCYGGSILSYKDGYYRSVPLEELTSKVVRTFNNATAPKAKTAYYTAQDLTWTPDFGRGTADGKICLLNGTLEVDSGTVRPWSPDDELLYRLDIEWNDSAECPQYDQFLRWVFAGCEESMRCWDEFCGLSLVDDMSFQKALFLLGGGSNGKSTLTGILSAIHNPSMISTVGITELDDERKKTGLVGKLLNISTEQSRINSITDDVFKKITGGDAIDVRRLYSEVENNVKLKVRFVCLANELPPMQDSSNAMKRRLIILRCPNQVMGEQVDTKLLDKLVAEKSGIVRRWVNALIKMRERGQFTIPEASTREVEDYVSSSDHVAQWLKRRIVQGGNQTMEVIEAHVDFVEYTRSINSRMSMPEAFFKRKLQSLGVEIKEHKLPDGRVISVMNGRLANDSISKDISSVRF